MNWWKAKLAIARAIHLDLTHNQVHYGRALQHYVRPGDRWLDVGCGYQILPDWAMSEEEQGRLVRPVKFLIGVDVDERIQDHPLLTHRVKGLGGSLPFRAETFDLVTANMVVEHIKEPGPFLADIARVLRPGGRFLFHTPNHRYWVIFLADMAPDWVKKPVIWALERRSEDDVFPTYYQMNTPERIARLAKYAGLEISELKMVGTTGAFDRLGLIGLAECFLLKGLQASFGGRFNSNIVGVLRRIQ